MIKIIACLSVLLPASGILGASFQVCVDDGASLLKAPVRGAMVKELQVILGGRLRGLEFERCRGGEPQIRLKIRSEAPAALRGVLGLAYRDEDRIAPELLIFYEPLVRYLGKPNNAYAVGRALARVAAHEASHFLDQRAHHCALGLMRAALPAYELSAKDSWPFRHSHRCENRQMAIAERTSQGAAEPAR